MRDWRIYLMTSGTFVELGVSVCTLNEIVAATSHRWPTLWASGRVIVFEIGSAYDLRLQLQCAAQAWRMDRPGIHEKQEARA